MKKKASQGQQEQGSYNQIGTKRGDRKTERKKREGQEGEKERKKEEGKRKIFPRVISFFSFF